jgi:hypothetical protein
LERQAWPAVEEQVPIYQGEPSASEDRAAYIVFNGARIAHRDSDANIITLPYLLPGAEALQQKRGFSLRSVDWRVSIHL